MAFYRDRGHIRHRVHIDQRPKIVEFRSRVGVWEIDSMVGQGHRGAIISMVEGNTRFTKIIEVTDKTAARVAVTLILGLENSNL